MQAKNDEYATPVKCSLEVIRLLQIFWNCKYMSEDQNIYVRK